MDLFNAISHPKNGQTQINSLKWHELSSFFISRVFSFFEFVKTINKRNRQNDISYARLCLHTLFISRSFFNLTEKVTKESVKNDTQQLTKNSSKLIELCLALFTCSCHFTNIFEFDRKSDKKSVKNDPQNWLKNSSKLNDLCTALFTCSFHFTKIFEFDIKSDKKNPSKFHDFFSFFLNLT